MWACALGHTEAAVVLYKWDNRALSIPDSLGRLPLTIARSRGHVKLAEYLEELQREDESQIAGLPQTPGMVCSPAEKSASDGWMGQWNNGSNSSQESQKSVSTSSTTGALTHSFTPSVTILCVCVCCALCPRQFCGHQTLDMFNLGNGTTLF